MNCISPGTIPTRAASGIKDFDAMLKHNQAVSCDEIYANSQTDHTNPKFVSAFSLEFTKNPEHWDRVHGVWGFAKDFGLAGFRIGVYFNRGRRWQEQIGETAKFSPFDTLNGRVVSNLLEEDGAKGRELMNLFQERLTRQHDTIAGALEREGIPRVENSSTASLFFFLDLRKWLDRPIPRPKGAEALESDELLLTGPECAEGEGRLFCYFRHKGVLLTPGQKLFTKKPGFFRMCYTAAEEDAVQCAVKLMGTVLRELGSM